MDAIELIKQLMEDTCRRPLSLAQLCEQVDKSYHSFRREFRRREGVSLSKYYQQVRLREAETLLRNSDKLIFEIADEIGFFDESDFSNWFLRLKGTRPTFYRQKFELDTDEH